MLMKDMLETKLADCHNTEDLISLEALAEVPAERLCALRVADKLYGFDIDNLFRWARKTRNLNPITNLPLSGLELALISQKYVDTHRHEGVVTIQINSQKGWSYGLLTLVVGDFNQKTVGQLVAPTLEAAAEAGINDFPLIDLAPLRFIYAGRELSRPVELKISDIPGFISGHKISISQ